MTLKPNAGSTRIMAKEKDQITREEALSFH
jgi:hypothetical protein